MSRLYDLFAGSERRFTATGIQMLDVDSDESILEIGCGTGHAIAELADKIENGMIIAIDISEGMLKVARKRIRCLKSNVRLCQADGFFLPFSAEQFNAVFLSFTLELFAAPEIPQVLSECDRVLKVDGRIVIIAIAKQETYAVRIYEWFHRHIPNLIDCRPIIVQTVLKEAGFITKKSTIQTMWGLPVEIIIAKKHQVAFTAS